MLSIPVTSLQSYSPLPLAFLVLVSCTSNSYMMLFFLLLPLTFPPGDPHFLHLLSAFVGLRNIYPVSLHSENLAVCGGKQIGLAVQWRS